MKLILWILLILSYTQTVAGKISGRITDTAGNALPFATILVKNTQLGVTANSDGYYSLTLPSGNYTIECHHVGYASSEKTVVLNFENLELDFILKIQNLEMEEIVIDPGAENPAYEIIRNAVKQRPYYNNQVGSFSADVYVKGIVKLINLPDKIFGTRINERDRQDMGLDSSGQGIIYLAESLTRVSEQKPDKIKMEVISNRVSGRDGFGLDFPLFINFYDNLVDISRGALSKRSFVSPIADNALSFYKYKFLGSFFENGKQVNSIRVIPRRRFEPLFSGVINITEGDWRLYSCKLFLTSESQLQIFDSLEITQIHTLQYKDIWRVKNQIIHFHVNQLGVQVEGNFVNVYKDYNFTPHFPKDFFDRIVIQYDKNANRKGESYWDTIRPVPLEKEEVDDFRVKDSLKIIQDSTAYNVDSIRMRFHKVKFNDVMVSGADWYLWSKKSIPTISLQGLMDGFQYNTVEGISVNPSLTFSKYLKKANSYLQVLTDVRYGFANRQLNPWAGVVLSNSNDAKGNFNYNSHKYFVAGGRRASQFFKLSPLSGLVSTFSTLLWGRNDMKLYENYFFKTGYEKSWLNGAKFLVEGLYENRNPLENATNYLLSKKRAGNLTPNFPIEVLDAQFAPHQAVVFHALFSYQPGQRYIQYPDHRFSLGSKMPVFTFQYYKGIPGLIGSDEDFDRWQFDIRDNFKINLGGRLFYDFGAGGFLNRKKVFVQDFKHYYGTNSHLVEDYVRSFQTTSIYQYSNTSDFYAELHLEHHADGMITNKLPLLRRWNWHLVDGVNALFVEPDRKHFEIFAGLENILKFIRIDAVLTLQDDSRPYVTYRFGFGGLLGDVFINQYLKRHEKIINRW